MNGTENNPDIRSEVMRISSIYQRGLPRTIRGALFVIADKQKIDGLLIATIILRYSLQGIC